MEKKLKYIGYILMFIIFNSVCESCKDDNNILDDVDSEESVVENILDNAYTVWNASKNEVQEQMNVYELVDSDADYLQYVDQDRVIKLSYSFVNDSLRAAVAIAPKLTNNVLSSCLKGYDCLGKLSSKDVYYNTSKNTMCFSYDVLSADSEYSIMGFVPIISDLYEGDISPKMDYKNLSYTIDGRPFKMILVDGGTLPAFYMMQTEVPLSGEFKIGGTYIGKIDLNGDKCITKGELRDFVNRLNNATGLDFRLPTEDEWKFAATGGVRSGNYTYSGSNNIDEVAWYSGNCKGIQEIASKQPNELGFYDMSGNYEEVCHNSPLEIDGNTFGGCWKYAASQCTPSSYRNGNRSTDKIPGTSVRELWAVDGRRITVRLVYSSPE